jgi:hypothetical protein
MVSPSPSEVHVDSLLTDFSVAYLQKQTQFIADRVFPRMPVNKQSDKYATFTLGDFFRDNMQRRADATESAGIDYTVSSDSYSTDLFALHMDVGKRVQANADAAHNPLEDATRLLTQQELIKRDREWVSNFWSTGIWGTDVTGGTNFTQIDDAASDPINLLHDAGLAVETATGFLPNTLVVDAFGHKALKTHPDIVGRVNRGQTTGAAAPTDPQIAELLGVERLLVARASYNTADKGATDPNPGLMSPTAGMTFVWNGDIQAAEGRTISRMEVPLSKATRVEIEAEWDMKVVASGLGYFFSGFVS